MFNPEIRDLQSYVDAKKSVANTEINVKMSPFNVAILKPLASGSSMTIQHCWTEAHDAFTLLIWLAKQQELKLVNDHNYMIGNDAFYYKFSTSI